VDIERPAPDDARPYGRRTFLTLVAGGASSLLWGPAAWNLARDVLLPVAGVLPPPLGGLVRSGWRIYSVTSIPHFDPATWSLKIDGLVERPVELSYADLRALPRAEQVTDFHCVTGWSVQNVHWGGVRFRDLLALARPLPSATAIRFVSLEEPYEDSLTLAQALQGDVMLAHELDGAPLSRPHGAPARVVIPEMYGYKGVKWLTRMELVAKQPTGYWENLGYDQNAWVGRSNGYHA
jgi:DMSO/TMAO reductase YedYZ molybdopterin-dependent catalytic subunit